MFCIQGHQPICYVCILLSSCDADITANTDIHSQICLKWPTFGEAELIWRYAIPLADSKDKSNLCEGHHAPWTDHFKRPFTICALPPQGDSLRQVLPYMYSLISLSVFAHIF